jgi:hypothetical protein
MGVPCFFFWILSGIAPVSWGFGMDEISYFGFSVDSFYVGGVIGTDCPHYRFVTKKQKQNCRSRTKVYKYRNKFRDFTKYLTLLTKNPLPKRGDL